MKIGVVSLMVAFLLLSTVIQSCGVCRNDYKIESVTVPYHNLGTINDTAVTISKNVDLNGGVCELPQGITLIFKGGLIKNGTLEGNGNRIIYDKEPVFDHVTIKGEWVVPWITTKMFAKLDDDNAIKNVFALANSKINNKIIVEKGNYQVSVSKEKQACITLSDNLELRLNGNIIIKPNAFESYDIIRVTGKNVSISGSGSLRGDRDTHLGSVGEWGMGIDIKNATDVTIKGLTITECWGDCIYIGQDSKNITLENCKLDRGRRQGVSVTDADGVVIRNCVISNVQGTNPQYAIDIEPNSGCKVDNVYIDCVTIQDCVGGVIVTKGSDRNDSKKIGDVKINNCNVNVLTKYPIRVKDCEKIIVTNCSIITNSTKNIICVSGVSQVVIKNNKLFLKDRENSLIGCDVNNVSYKKGGAPIVVIGAEVKDIGNNKLNDEY